MQVSSIFAYPSVAGAEETLRGRWGYIKTRNYLYGHRYLSFCIGNFCKEGRIALTFFHIEEIRPSSFTRKTTHLFFAVSPCILIHRI
jgi:hypothetical protein